MKNILMFFVVVALALCCLSIPAYSDYGAAPLFIPGIRAMGMGGAFLALADDHNAFFYNPAGISQRVSPSFSFFDISLLINANSYSFCSSLVESYIGEQPFYQDPAQLLTYVNENMLNKKFNFYSGLPANLSFISAPIGYFSVGIGLFLSSINMTGSVTTESGLPNISVTANMDSAIVIPIAYAIGDNIILGASAKVINRIKLIDIEDTSIIDFYNFTSGELMHFPNSLFGWGYGFDAGVMFHLGDQLTLGATVKDLAGTKINYTDEVGRAPIRLIDITNTTEEIPPRLNLGIAYVFSNEQLPMGDNVTFTAQYNDLTGRLEEVDRGTIKLRWKNIHAGIELAWNMLSIRAGLNQGYVTAGLGFFLGPMKIDYAYYGEEVGLYAADQVQINHFFSCAVRFN